jgi:hypothetical protein
MQVSTLVHIISEHVHLNSGLPWPKAGGLAIGSMRGIGSCFCGFLRNLSAKLTSHDALDIDTCLGGWRAGPVPDCLHALPNIHVEIATFMPTLELPWRSSGMIYWVSGKRASASSGSTAESNRRRWYNLYRRNNFWFRI